MSRAAVVTQVQLLPRIHQVKRYADADVLVLMDDHQFGPHWQRRTLLKGQEGVFWLTVPTSGSRRGHVKEIQADLSQETVTWLLETIRHAYSRATFFEEVFGQISGLIRPCPRPIYELNRLLTYWILTYLDIGIEVVEQSALGTFTETKTDLMVSLTKAAGCDVYHCGQEAIDHFYETEKFEEAGIALWPQNWEQPKYRQLWEGDFRYGLSILDMLMNVGRHETRRLLDVR
ncbi:MAG: WbqC family protein [Chloroflexota bacterium]